MILHLTEYKNSRLFYQKIGTGPKVLLAFHGFGQDHTAFHSLTHVLKDDYTIYSFDIYFHGKSEWRYDELPIEKKFWKEVIENFLNENKINKFSLVGFSLGCRLVMATTEELYYKIEDVILLAPDGIKTNFWYNVSTYPLLFRKIFKNTINHPRLFKTLAQTFYKLKLVDKGLLRFAEYQMNTEEKRKKVYYSWVVFRHLKFNLQNFAQIVNKNNIPVIIAVGKHDRVIVPSNMKHFIKLIQNVNFQILNAGHANLLTNPSISTLFNVSHSIPRAV